MLCYEHCQADKKSPFLYFSSVPLKTLMCFTPLYYLPGFWQIINVFSIGTLTWWLDIFTYLLVWIRLAPFCFSFNDLGSNFLPPYSVIKFLAWYLSNWTKEPQRSLFTLQSEGWGVAKTDAGVYILKITCRVEKKVKPFSTFPIESFLNIKPENI